MNKLNMKSNSSKLESKKIFVIDDDEIMIELVTKLLEVAGFSDIHGFVQSTEALELLRFVCPDLIITDIHMPELDGTFFAKMVTEFPHINSVPMLAMTADDSPETREKAKRNGISDVVLKPIEGKALIEKVLSVIKLNEIGQDLEASQDRQFSLEAKPVSKQEGELYKAFGR